MLRPLSFLRSNAARSKFLIAGVILCFVSLLAGCFASSEEAAVTSEPESTLDDRWYNLSIARPLFGDFDAADELQLLPTENDAPELAARGEYLTKHVAACGACHAKQIDDPASPLSGGQIRYDRFGEVRAANITPDRQTGIGNWSIAEIIRAVRASIDRRGKPLSIDVHQNYRWLSNKDAQAIAFYLLTSQPIRKTIPRRELGPFERNKFALFPQHTEVKGYVPEFTRANEVAYGRYLAEHVAQCYSCHTAPETLFSSPIAFGGSKNKYEAFSDLILKNFFSSESNVEPELLTAESRRELELEATKHNVWWDSGDDTPDKIYAPDIRGGAGAPLGDWSADAFTDFLSSGTTPEGRKVSSDHCPWNFYSAMSGEDKRAIASFLKTLS